MRLTSYTDFTLRTLIYLGLNGNERATIREISECYGISRNHLMKIVQDLSHQGLISTIRGKSGGMYLLRDPSEINVGALVRRTEADFRLVECFEAGPNGCRLTGGCVLTSALRDALEAFFEVLDGYTLADLLRPQRNLRRLLGMNSAIS